MPFGGKIVRGDLHEVTYLSVADLDAIATQQFCLTRATSKQAHGIM